MNGSAREGVSRLVEVWRASSSAVAATLIDFLCVIVLVSYLRVGPVLATGIGCLVGALVNFWLNRLWTFGSTAPVHGQVLRYAVVSSSSMVLNSAGMNLILNLFRIDYRGAWWLIRVLVFLGWNFPLQRMYVFR